MTLDQIHAWRNSIAATWKRAGAPMFLDLPDAWYEEPHWFCVNGHVSTMYIRSETAARCPACGQNVILGPPVGEEEFQRFLEMEPNT